MRATIATEVGVEIATTGARAGVPEGRQDDEAEEREDDEHENEDFIDVDLGARCEEGRHVS